MRTRRIERRAVFGGALLAVTAGLTVAGAVPAEAHQVCQSLGGNWGCVSSNHQTVSAHDVQCDDQYFYTRYQTTQFPGLTYTIADQNGCRAGGTYANVAPYQVTSIRVCTPLNDCLPWQSA